MTFAMPLKSYSLSVLLLTVGFFVGVSVNHALGEVSAGQVSDTVLSWSQTSHASERKSASVTEIQQAVHWELSVTQWERYRSLLAMGVAPEYERLTPVEVLGIHAQSEEELHRLAKLAAKQKEERIARELRFGQAIFEAEKILFQDRQAVLP
jgi:hypothetical protein